MTCPSCGEDNPARARFCLACGSALLARPTVAEERKVVSILFCDLVGFTATSEQSDPEDVRARIDPYFARLRAAAQAYGGTVDKYIGDAVMAVFGAPVAHEDDPERAVRVGLRILEEISDLNEADPTLGLVVRIGINTGEVLARLGSPDETKGIVTGDVVNTASRLQTVAPEDGIVVSEATYLATKDVFEFEALPPVAVKGKAQPLPIWRVLSSRARFGTDLLRTHSAPLVGREDELELLKRTFARSVRDASTQLLTIVGEPGVGKSRLVSELDSYVDSLPDLVTWRQGRCLPYGEGITFWALGEIVKAHAGILESDPPEIASSKLDRVLPEGEDREWFRQRMRPLLGLEATTGYSREESFTAWRRFLEQIAESRPAVFVFEDLHWADPALLDFLEHVVEYAEGVPLLLVATARPELFERASGWGSAGKRSHHQSLARLSDADTAALVASLLDQALLPADVQSMVLDRAGGNPLYAEEFVRMLKDRELLVRRGRSWELAEGAEVPAPSSISALIAARLDTLSPDRKSLLHDAAVLGKVFWSGPLATMADRDPASVAEALHELSRKELIRPARMSSIEGEAEYAFWHALVRDVAYGQIPRAARSAKHQAAATWLEGMAGDRIEDHAEILAYHTTTALELAKASGHTDLGDLEASSLRYLVLAGDRTLSLDVAQAEAHYARALDLTPAPHPSRPSVLVKWADAIRQRGHPRESVAAYEEAIAAFRHVRDASSAAMAMGKLAISLRRLADPRRGEVAAAAVALIASEPPTPELVAVYADAAGTAFAMGDSRRAVSWAARAIDLAGELGLTEPTRALGFRGGARCDLGDAGGLEDLERALELAVAEGQGRDAGVMCNNLAYALWAIKGPSPALELVRQGTALSERRGCEELALSTAASSLDLLVDLGAFDELIRMSPSLARRAEEAGSIADLVEVRWAMARTLARRGDFKRAGPLADMIERDARDSREPVLIVAAFPVAALVRLGRGEMSEALSLLSEMESTERVRELPNYPAYLPDMVRTSIAAGQPELGVSLTAGLDPVLDLYRHAVVTAAALLAEQRGEWESAAEQFGEATRRWEGFEMPWEQAQALLGQGRCLLALDCPLDAEPPLRTARALFARLGARPALAETDGLLVRTVARTS